MNNIDEYYDRAAQEYYEGIDTRRRCPMCNGEGKIYYRRHRGRYIPCTWREYELAIKDDPLAGGYWDECEHCNGTGNEDD